MPCSTSTCSCHAETEALAADQKRLAETIEKLDGYIDELPPSERGSNIADLIKLRQIEARYPNQIRQGRMALPDLIGISRLDLPQLDQSRDIAPALGRRQFVNVAIQLLDRFCQSLVVGRKSLCFGVELHDW